MRNLLCKTDTSVPENIVGLTRKHTAPNSLYEASSHHNRGITDSAICCILASKYEVRNEGACSCNKPGHIRDDETKS